MAGITFAIETWRATRANALVEEITGLVTGGRVEMNVDRAVKRMGTLSLREPDALTPYVDYVAPFIVLAYDDGTPTLRQQVGLFTLRSPKGQRSATLALGEYALHDLCYELLTSEFSAPYTVSAQPYTQAVAAVIEAAGITHHAIPAQRALMPGARTFPVGANRLDVINEGLQAAGLYAAYTDGEGRIASSPLLPLATTEPLMTVGNADIMGAITDQPVDRDPVNVVIAIKDRTNEAPLTSVARNDDPASPTSTVRLGREIVRREAVNDIADQATLDAYAARLLAEGRSFYQTAKVRLKPNPAFVAHDTLDFAFTGELEAYNGRWWVRAWTMGLGVADPTITVEVNRVTDTWQGLAI